MLNLSTEKVSSIALFPGSFKPPHRDHVAAIEYLLHSLNIDKVGVIIANRSRRLPGSILGIDARTSLLLFEKMFQWSPYDRERLFVEVAEHTAIEHALDYFKTVDASTKLYFCLGGADAQAGDRRFERIQGLSIEHGVEAELLALPRLRNPIRATDLREALANADMDTFCAALPTWLTNNQKREFWQLTTRELCSLDEIREEKVARLVQSFLSVGTRIKKGSYDSTGNPKFYAVTTDCQEVEFKYAGDELSNNSPHQHTNIDCPERIGIERRAINRINPYSRNIFQLPEIVLYEKREKLLGLNLGAGSSLADTLNRGEFDIGVAVQLGEILRQLHSIPVQERPIWGSFKNEEIYLDYLVRRRLENIEHLCAVTASKIKEIIESESLFKQHITHAKFVAENIKVLDKTGKVLVHELDACLARADGAIDLADMIVDYLSAGFRSKKINDMRLALNELMAAYWAEPAIERVVSLPRVCSYVLLQLANTSRVSKTTIEALEKLTCQMHPQYNQEELLLEFSNAIN